MAAKSCNLNRCVHPHDFLKPLKGMAAAYARLKDEGTGGVVDSLIVEPGLDFLEGGTILSTLYNIFGIIKAWNYILFGDKYPVKTKYKAAKKIRKKAAELDDELKKELDKIQLRREQLYSELTGKDMPHIEQTDLWKK